MAIQAQMYSGFVCGPPQDLLTDNICTSNNLNFITQQQEEQHSMQRVQQQQQQPLLPKNNLDAHQSISAQIENQRMEIDFFITLQNEKLRMALQEQRKRQTASLMHKFESKIQSLFSQKEEEMKRAASRNMELRMFLERIEFENQTWQRVARENEAMVASLNGTIERLRESAINGSAAEDAESCCMEREEDNERETRKKMMMMICRGCNSRKSCVIMLPCRHLCSCVDCDAWLDLCPVCKMVKESSVEVLV